MNLKKGILLKVCSTLSATLMFVCVKGLNGQIPTGEVVFFRSFFAMVPLLVWLGVQGSLGPSLRTNNLFGHLGRSISGTLGMFFNFLALAYLPLADATALGYAAPLFTVVLAAVLLREIVGRYRWMAVLAGFAGVVVMLSPHLEFSGGLDHGAVLGGICALLGALSGALSSIQIRHLNGREHPGAIVFYFSLMTTLIGLGTIALGWAMPTPEQLLLLIGSGLFGGLTQILVVLSLRNAHASLLAPFDYTTLIWSVALGILLLGQYPTLTVLLGAVIVIGAGLFTLWRESRLQRADPERVKVPAETVTTIVK